MSVIYLELANVNIQDTSMNTYSSGRWDGYADNPIPENFAQGSTAGYGGTWGGIQSVNVPPFGIIPYIGYDTNFAASAEPIVILFVNGKYTGYDTNFAAVPASLAPQFPVTDVDSVSEYPKTQFVYFKLKGYNPNTHSYENWIIKEDITTRPEEFNPGAHNPSIERDVYRQPPSGDALVNITIVARWIQ